MDDLVAQLRQLGDAVEADTQAVTLDDIAEHTALDAVALDIGLVPRAVPQPMHPRRRPSRRILGAAAALVLLVGGSIAFIGRPAEDQRLDLASAVQLDGPFAVPEDDNGWQQLRVCESTNDYGIDTGNTFYGAYQFTHQTFRLTASELGLDAWVGRNPALAPPEVQDTVANAMYLERGDEPWPVCGRYIKGPMITPVVPQWIGASQLPPEGVVVFISPSIESDRLAEIGSEITEILGADTGRTTEITFVDKAEAFAEFQEMFVGDEITRNSVDVEAMPASFRIARSLSPQESQQMRDITGVFEVIEAAARQPSKAPMRLAIPAIGLEAPVYPTTSLTDLSLGAVVMVENPASLVIGGYGSAPGSVFGRLGELRDGDSIIVSTLIIEPVGSWEIARTFKVGLNGDDAPTTFDLGDLSLTEDESTRQLILVADVDGDPLKRLVVHAQTSVPDLNNYPN